MGEKTKMKYAQVGYIHTYHSNLSLGKIDSYFHTNGIDIHKSNSIVYCKQGHVSNFLVVFKAFLLLRMTTLNFNKTVYQPILVVSCICTDH